MFKKIYIMILMINMLKEALLGKKLLGEIIRLLPSELDQNTHHLFTLCLKNKITVEKNQFRRHKK